MWMAMRRMGLPFSGMESLKICWQQDVDVGEVYLAIEMVGMELRWHFTDTANEIWLRDALWSLYRYVGNEYFFLY
jgi:hypothetical protein